MRDDYIIINQISKQYGVVKALDNVSFTVKQGEIHALLGENGAGKSTLVKIINGEEHPSKGSIELDGKMIEIFHPNYTRDIGIQMVHQELVNFKNLSVAENIFPWMLEDKDSFKKIDWNAFYKKAKIALEMFDIKTISPSQKLGTLSLANQQMIEILRCIHANPKVLLLDEPTSGLNSMETSSLMQKLLDLREKGLTIIYISHRLDEILEIADRVTIMRDGQYINTLTKEQMDEQTLINSMVGREFSNTLYHAKHANSKTKNEVLLDVKHISKKNVLEDSPFTLHTGEVLGFFGVEGSGTDALSRMMFGLENHDHAEIYFEGKKIKKVSSAEMVDKGILYLYGNRKNAGLLLDMPVTDNFAVPQLKALSNKWSFIKTSRLKRITEDYIERFSIAIPSLNTCPQNLSGGNQQKVMLAVCIARNPKLLIVNDPTRGIDVGAKFQIYEKLKELTTAGVSIIVFSSELPELLLLCDRIIVMHENKINGEVFGEEMMEQSIMRLASIKQ